MKDTDDPFNARWSKEADFFKAAQEYREFNHRFKVFIEDLAERPTRHELDRDDHAIVPTYKDRSEEYDDVIRSLRELLEEQKGCLMKTRRKTYKIIRNYSTNKEWCSNVAATRKRDLVPGQSDKIVKFVETRYGDVLMSKAEYTMLWQLMDNVINASQSLLDVVDMHPHHADRPEAENHHRDTLVQLDVFFNKMKNKGAK